MSWSNPPAIAYTSAVSLGIIPGHTNHTASGRSLLLGPTGGFTAIWDGNPTIGDWVAPKQDRIHDIASTSGLDILLGTGAQRILISGISNDLFTQEVIDMNGVDLVATVRAYSMIHRMDVIQSGTTLLNQGDISATAQTDVTVTALMLAGNNRTFSGIYKTARNENFLIKQYVASVERSSGGGTDADFRLLAFNEDLRIATGSITVSTTAAGTSAIEIPIEFPQSIPPNTYVIAAISPSQTNTIANAVLHGERVQS